MKASYYNENDPFAAAWLRELIKAGLIADGEVDERSITDVRPDDLRGFGQCHFFAGIGGWSYALRLAGWSDDRPVWTGSCPCQPFSSAGKGDGADDPRHLWPAWFRLIGECRPDTIFGEQVASVDGLAWFDRVSTDLEGADYAVGAVDLGAASVGAPHIRQRLWFVGYAGHARLEKRSRVGRLQPIPVGASTRQGAQCSGDVDVLADDNEGRRPLVGSSRLHADGQSGHDLARRSQVGDMADANGSVAGEERLQRSRPELQSDHDAPVSPWDAVEWIECRDGKARPIEPGLEPLAHGLPVRVGRLRGYGNAIVPQVAAAFIEAYMRISDGG